MVKASSTIAVHNVNHHGLTLWTVMVELATSKLPPGTSDVLAILGCFSKNMNSPFKWILWYGAFTNKIFTNGEIGRLLSTRFGFVLALYL